MRFWWVNHNQTWQEEIAGGYLWSPRREARSRSQFYDNMRIATRGDIVLSYSRQRLRYIGVVTDDAVSAPKPSEFGSKGAYWADEGWMLPVVWRAVPTPLSPKTLWSRLESLLPSKYSPLDRNGDGAQKAYFAEVPPDAFYLLAEHCGVSALPVVDPIAPRFDAIEAELDDIVQAAVATDTNLDATQKTQVVLARRGQGLFRERVSKIEPSCRLTGVRTPTLLVASHIKPWRSCTTAQERLDGANGLLLTPTIDRLFDRGLITFANDGTVKPSLRLSAEDQVRVRLDDGESPRPFTGEQIAYLEHHRNVTFLS